MSTHHRRSFRPAVETLDSRIVLAANDINVFFRGSTLVIQGTPFADQILVQPDSQQIGIFVEATPTHPESLPGTNQQLFAIVGTRLVTRIEVNGGGGSDKLTVNGTIPTQVNGGAGNDTIITGAGDDFIIGGAGDDSITAGLGNDNITAGLGNDTVNGNGGNDTIRGGGGNDSMLGGLGNDFVDGGNGSDVVVGNAGDDTLIGGLGRDTVRGGPGNDTIRTRDGILDIIRRGPGNDTIIRDPFDILTT